MCDFLPHPDLMINKETGEVIKPIYRGGINCTTYKYDDVPKWGEWDKCQVGIYHTIATGCGYKYFNGIEMESIYGKYDLYVLRDNINPTNIQLNLKENIFS